MALNLQALEKVTLPGFTVRRTPVKSSYDNPHPGVLEWVNADDTIRLRINGTKMGTFGVGGTTTFKIDGRERTFDRLGIDDSFFISPKDTLKSVRETFLGQLEKVKVTSEHIARSVVIPGFPLGTMLTPERKAEITALLQKGKSHLFPPSGMGTAYQVSRKQMYRYDQRADPKTEAFFGVGPLWLHALDWD